MATLLHDLLHVMTRTVLSRVDLWYQRHHRLHALGPVLRVGRVRYRGPLRQFADGTILRTDELIGELHFNNASIAAIGARSVHGVGFRFARLMRESLHALARGAQSDPALQDIQVFHGVTWLPQHGEVVGFESTPLAATWRTRWLSAYFKLLHWTFAPSRAARRRRMQRRSAGQPRDFWLTRAALAGNIDKLKELG